MSDAVRGSPERAWPFENRPEVVTRIRTPRQFVTQRGNEVDAVVVRIGLHDAQLVLVDGVGRWERWVYPSVEEAEKAARDLGVPVQVGQYPEEVRVRMNSYRQSREEFDRVPYPEQGEVGPVLPYPENRPRSVEPQIKETDASSHS